MKMMILKDFAQIWNSKIPDLSFVQNVQLIRLKHASCKKNLKRFGQIIGFISKTKDNLLNLTNSLNGFYAQVKYKVKEKLKKILNDKQIIEKNI
ncbi:unnamed protein product [Paramecium sonneborni]|uniref:Uncharacterized protein n=1 Tax=Paramecium sonneborni TaxID=65129 RepID=A0A8S1RS14_9CILI|nr:unnamed protein product [Paramecium sonneborni]